MPEETQQPNNEQTELEQLQAQSAEYLAGWQRAKADYVNLKKETENKQKVLIDVIQAGLIMEILPVYDNLKKAVALLGDEKNNWQEGIKQIKKQFEDFLKSYEVEEIKTIGEKFNPEFHEAILREKKEGVAPDSIISEASSGYLLKGKVLQPAKVVVAE